MKEAISTWIEALRSGDYKQTRISLYDETNCSFCCLGVYAQVNELFDFSGHNFAERGFDQEKIYKKLYETIDYDFAWKLIRLNDNLPSSNFNEIADVIEKEYSK